MAKKVRANSEEYWNDRMVALTAAQYELTDELCEEIAKYYRLAQDEVEKELFRLYERLAANNKVSYADALKIMDAEELEEFHWSVEQYIRAGRENAVNQRWMQELENASARVHIRRLDALKLQIEQQIEMLAKQTEEATDSHLAGVYTEKYYQTGYEISRNLGIGIQFDVIGKEAVDLVLKQPWASDGKVFSERIWDDRDALVNSLHDTLSQDLILGKSVPDMTRDLRKRIESSESNAERLIRTETAAIMSQADEQMYDDIGVELFEIDATLDTKTCAVCCAMDRKQFPMDQYKIGTTASPFHPTCRCCTVPTVDDDLGVVQERAARDANGKYIRVPRDMTYKDWKAKYVREKGRTSATESDIISIPRSVGASGRNYPVKTPSGDHVKLAEGTQITKIKTIMGAGTDIELRYAIYLESNYKIPAQKWKKVRGEGVIVEDGIKKRAELHWYEAEDERVEMKVKVYFDEG